LSVAVKHDPHFRRLVSPQIGIEKPFDGVNLNDNIYPFAVENLDALNASDEGLDGSHGMAEVHP
jgi:hypothetical protein